MKKVNTILLWLLVIWGTTIPVWGNLPTTDSCGDPCNGQQGQGGTGTRSGGGGNKSASGGTGDTKKSSVNVLINWGSPANEDIGIYGYFSIYTKQPSSLVYSPQIVQYVNMLLDRISFAEVNPSHQDKILYSNSVSLAQNGVAATPGMSMESQTRYSLRDDLSADVTHQIKIFTKNREVMTFEFRLNDPIGRMVGDKFLSNYTLRMRDLNGNETTERPVFYDLHLGQGNFVRYSVSTGEAVFFRTAAGRTIRPESATVGLDPVYDADGTVRQVWSLADGLADVVVTEIGVSYEIRCYSPEQVGPKVDGAYTVTGDPHTVWRVENPTPGNNNNVKVTRTTGGISEVSLFEYSYNSEGWMLTSPGELMIDSDSTSWDYSRTVRTVSSVKKSRLGEVSSRTNYVYQTFPFGEYVVATAADPEGLNLRQAFTYYTDSNESGSYGRPKTRSEGDGSWSNYQYDAYGRTTSVVTPWLNSPFNSAAADALETRYGFEPHDSRDMVETDDQRPRTIETKILGQTVNKKYFAYYFDNNCYVKVEEVCTVPDAVYGAAGNLRTVRRYYATGECTSPSAGLPHTVTYPDGTCETYIYEYGTYQQNADPAQSTFIPGTGNAVRTTVTHGTAEHPAGIANKTLRKSTVYDERGNTVRTTESVYTGNSYTEFAWTASLFDGRRRKIAEYKSNGEITETGWDCCRKSFETQPDGTQYTYVYDALGRMASKIRVGIGNIPELTTTYAYDADNRVLCETVSSGGLSYKTNTEYNHAGLPIKKTDRYGLVTQFSYQGGINTGSNLHGLVVTATLPGGTQQILNRYVDGQNESVTGNATVPVYYRYSIDGNNIRRKELTGGGDSPRWKELSIGMNRQVISEVRSGFGGDVTELYTFNNKNQLSQVIRSGYAPILIEYDALGAISRFGLDVNADGILAPASNDRIFDRENAYMTDGGIWQVLTEKLYGTLNSATATVNSITKERLAGFAANVTAETREIDVHGNQTVRQTLLDRATKTRTESILHPDSTVTELKIYRNGLLLSERNKSDITTTYAYDTIDRLVSAAEPRTGTATISYHDRGWFSSVTDAAGNTMTADFDQQSGRLNSIKNALDKYSRYAYNNRGQIIRIWGDTEYPLEFSYNQYGDQVGMKTYRTGSAWNGVNWPASAPLGDATAWVIDPATGLVTQKLDAKGKGATYTYTADGKLFTRTWARQKDNQPLITSYGYDSATGQLLSIGYSDVGTTNVTYTYNRLGQLASVTDAAGTRTFGFTAGFDRASETVSGIYDKLLTYNYETGGIKGRYLGFSLDNLLGSSYSYDGYGRLNKIVNGAGSFDYTRLAGSELTENLTRPNGVNTVWSYESNRDLVTQVSHGGKSVYGYVNDAIGRRTSMSRSGSVFTASDVLNYTYNDRSEVTGANSNVHSAYSYSYNFDPIGNRTTANLGGTAFSYTANLLNQYTAINSQEPTYDDDGNMLTRSGWTNTWNGENRLIETVKGDQCLTFTYDYMGRRIEKKVYEGETLMKHTRFVYNDYKLVEELDALNNNATIRHYTWQPEAAGLDVPLTVTEGNATYFYHTDANKNVTELTDVNGNVAAHYEYSPFGKITAMTGAYAEQNPFRFSSEYYDSETQLVYYNYRYYDPQLGRWLSRDPIEEEGGWNLYQFILNAPCTYFDHLGLDTTIMGTRPRNSNEPYNVGRGPTQDGVALTNTFNFLEDYFPYLHNFGAFHDEIVDDLNRSLNLPCPSNHVLSPINIPTMPPMLAAAILHDILNSLKKIIENTWNSIP